MLPAEQLLRTNYDNQKLDLDKFLNRLGLGTESCSIVMVKIYDLCQLYAAAEVVSAMDRILRAMRRDDCPQCGREGMYDEQGRWTYSCEGACPGPMPGA